MEKVDLKAKAKECLKFNKTAKRIIVVSDGTCFLGIAKNHAQVYANSKGLEVVSFDREELIEELKKTTTKKVDEDHVDTDNSDNASSADSTPENTSDQEEPSYKFLKSLAKEQGYQGSKKKADLYAFFNEKGLSPADLKTQEETAE